MFSKAIGMVLKTLVYFIFTPAHYYLLPALLFTLAFYLFYIAKDVR